MVELKKADKEGLSIRDNGIGIIFGGAYVPGQKLSQTVEEADQVTLKNGDQYVLIDSVKEIGPNQYTGTIYGFENPIEIKSGNLNIGDVINFRDSHIFTCGKKG